MASTPHNVERGRSAKRRVPPWTERLARRLLCVVLAATALTACGAHNTASRAVSPIPPVTFTTVGGETIPAATLRGKVVLVNFWATDCPICLKEMPQMVATYQAYQARGLETVAVAMWYDPPNQVVAYTQKKALPFKVAFDPMGEHARAFGDVTGTPTTFVIDKRGNIVSRIVGAPDFARLHALIEAKLAEPASG